MKSIALLTCIALSFSLTLSACQAPAATGTAPMAPRLASEIAPLPKGPRQPIASPIPPELVLPKLSFTPLFPLNSGPSAAPGSSFGPGTKGPGAIGGGGGREDEYPISAPSHSPSSDPGYYPHPIATSDISVVEKSTFNGKVFDNEGSPLDGAKVTAKSLNTSVPFEASTTTAGGTYAFNNAPAGVQVLITVTVPDKPPQQRVEVLKSNKTGDPNANRYDFGTDGSDSPFGDEAYAIGNPTVLTPVPTPKQESTPTPTPTPTSTPTPVPTPTPTPTPLPDQNRAGLLTAGAWRDLDNWEFWLKLVAGQSQQELIQQAQQRQTQNQTQNQTQSQSSQTTKLGTWGHMLEYWGISPVHRLGVKLKSGGQAVIDLALLLRDATGREIARTRSDNQGQAVFFAGLFASEQGPFRIETEDGSAILTNLYPAGEDHVIELTEAKPASQLADLMLMVDSTGSMGDELEFLKVELHNVIEKVKAADSQLQMRFSANFYRDRGDEYLVRAYPFTTEFSEVQKNLLAQSADGGDDTPEAVTDALENALEQHQWSQNARARLLFLVLDAPPHYEAGELSRLRKSIRKAQELGVRIIPVASSGIDKETEFLLRMLAITTGGEYVFLTDHSGVGGAHLEPSIGKHEVEKLNALMLRLIRKYCD